MFLGRGLLALKCFNILTWYSSNLKIKSVVTRDDIKDKWLCDLPEAQTNFVSNSLRNETEIISKIKNLKINILLVVQHPWILSENVLNAVEGYSFNLHNAKLPEYKGHNTISHAILNREEYYWSTIHWMLPEVDSGPIAYSDKIKIDKEDTAWSIYNKTFKIVIRNFTCLLNDFILNTPIPRYKQSWTGRYYEKNEIDNLKEIKNLNDFDEVDRKVRAFTFPGKEPAYYKNNGAKFYLARTWS